LAADTAGASVPAALTQTTLRAALMFRAGETTGSVPTVLAEEVLRAMSLTKVKYGAALVLALALIGTGVGAVARSQVKPSVAAPERPAERAKKETAGKQALPRAWEGRWIAAPFAGAEWIEVRHSQQGTGVPRTYLIKDSKAVAAVARAARIVDIR